MRTETFEEQNHGPQSYFILCTVLLEETSTHPVTGKRIWEGAKYDGVRGVVCDRLPQKDWEGEG